MLRPTYPLRTSRLRLRPFTRDDLDRVHPWFGDPAVVRFLPWELTTDRSRTRQALDRWTAQTVLTEAGQRLTLAVELAGPAGPGEPVGPVGPVGPGELAGLVVLKWLSRRHRQGEVGFVVSPAMRGNGYAVEAASALITLAFEGLGLHRVIGRCDPRNTASARVLERLGLRREAHLVHTEFVDGGWLDELVYAVLAPEWTLRRTGGED